MTSYRLASSASNRARSRASAALFVTPGATLCGRTPQARASIMAQDLVVTIDIDIASIKFTIDIATMKLTNTDDADVHDIVTEGDTTCTPCGLPRGLSRSSQGQANRSTKPPSQSSKATDESELREDGPAESAIAESTAAGLAAAESATAATAAGMAAPESATRREPVSTRRHPVSTRLP